MSVGDTGWVDGERKIGPLAHRPAFRLLTYSNQATRRIEWRMIVGNIHLLGDEADLESAKRAAEDALRQLCRDTLTALGDGDV